MSGSVRDYNRELEDADGSRYVYEFDTDVIHPLMIRSFRPFFRSGNLLELGSSKGELTRRMLEYHIIRSSGGQYLKTTGICRVH